MLSRLLQYLKVLPLITLRVEGRLIAENLQPWNALSPIEVTLSGIVIEVKPHHEKALSPIDVRVSGSLTEAKALQLEKTACSILVTP